MLIVKTTVGHRSHSFLAVTGATVNVIELKCTLGLSVKKINAETTGIDDSVTVLFFCPIGLLSINKQN